MLGCAAEYRARSCSKNVRAGKVISGFETATHFGSGLSFKYSVSP
jgi:hypothetical protein